MHSMTCFHVYNERKVFSCPQLHSTNFLFAGIIEGCNLHTKAERGVCTRGTNIPMWRNPAAALKHNGGKEGANTEKQYNFPPK